MIWFGLWLVWLAPLLLFLLLLVNLVTPVPGYSAEGLFVGLLVGLWVIVCWFAKGCVRNKF